MIPDFRHWPAPHWARSASIESTLVARQPAIAKPTARLTEWLFGTQCIEGIDAGGPPRGEPAGEQGGGDEQADDSREGQGIKGADAEEQALQGAGHGGR